MSEGKTYAARFPADLAARIEAVTDPHRNPFAPRISSLMVNAVRAYLPTVEATLKTLESQPRKRKKPG